MTQHSVSQKTNEGLFAGTKLFMFAIAAGFFLFAAVFVFWNVYQLLTFTKTEGVVASVKVSQTSGKTPATFYELWVGFRDSKYQIYTHAGTSVFYSPYKKGDKVAIYYNSRHPNEAFVNTFGTIWLVPTILFLIGLLPLIISASEIKREALEGRH